MALHCAVACTDPRPSQGRRRVQLRIGAMFVLVLALAVCVLVLVLVLGRPALVCEIALVLGLAMFLGM